MRGFRFRSSVLRSCLRPSAEHVSACGRRNEAPRCTRGKTAGTQGSSPRMTERIQILKRRLECISRGQKVRHNNASALSSQETKTLLHCLARNKT